MLDKPQKYSLAFLSFIFLGFMHYNQPHVGGIGTDLPYNNTTLLGIVLFIGWGLFHFSASQQLVVSKFTLLYTAAVACLLIPLAYPESDIYVAEGTYLFTLGLLIPILFILDQIKTDINWIKWLLGIIACSALIEILVSILILMEWPPFTLWQNGRPAGVFLQPNVFCSYIITGLACSLATTSSRFEPPLTKWLPKIPLLCCLLVPFFVVVETSRYGYIALTFVVALFCFSHRQFSHPKQAVLLMSLSVILGFLYVTSQTSGTEFIAYKAASLGARVEVFPLSISLAVDNIWTGVGYSSFEQTVFSYILAAMEGNGVPASLANLTHPHNEALFLIAQTGMIGLIAVGLIAWIIIRSFLNAGSSEKKVLLLLIGPLLLHSQIGLPFFTSTVHLLLFILLLYVASPYLTRATLDSGAIKSLLKPIGLTILLVGIPFYASALHSIHLAKRFETENVGSSVYRGLINPFIIKERYEDNISALQLANANINNEKVKKKLIEFYKRRMIRKPRSVYIAGLCLAYAKYGELENAKATLKTVTSSFKSSSYSEYTKMCSIEIDKLGSVNYK